MRVASLLVALALTPLAAAQSPQKLRAALEDRVSDAWIYEDIGKGYAEAKKTGKPLLVCFRCVP